MIWGDLSYKKPIVLGVPFTRDHQDVVRPIGGLFMHWDKEGYCRFVAKCPNYKQVKVEHHKQGGLYQDIIIPTWKCGDLNMDFIVGLPRTQRQYDLI